MTWQTRLERAATPGAVVEVARDFLATLDYFEIARLPDLCKPRKLLTPHDVSSYAFDLVHYHCGETDSNIETVHRLAAFFAHANQRLARIMLRTNDEDGALDHRA